MYSVFVILALISAFFLVIVVLAQNSKGGGLSNQFGGSGASSLIGVKKTGDLLERLTWGFAIAIMVFTLATNFATRAGTDTIDPIIENAKTQAPPAQQLPIPSTTPATPAKK